MKNILVAQSGELAVPIEEVANQEKKVPPEWINENGNGVTVFRSS